MRSCVRPLHAARMAAGPDEIRGSTSLIIPTSSRLNDDSGMCRSPVRPVVLITNTLALAFGWVVGFPIGKRYVTVCGWDWTKQFLGSTKRGFSVPTWIAAGVARRRGQAWPPGHRRRRREAGCVSSMFDNLGVEVP